MKHTIRGNARTVALLGSVAVLAGGATAVAATSGGDTSHAAAASASQSSTAPSGPVSDLTSGERTALEAVQAAIKADTSSIATPILDKAVTAGTITSAQESTLLTLLENGPGMMAGAGPGGGHPAGAPPASS